MSPLLGFYNGRSSRPKLHRLALGPFFRCLPAASLSASTDAGTDPVQPRPRSFANKPQLSDDVHLRRYLVPHSGVQDGAHMTSSIKVKSTDSELCLHTTIEVCDHADGIRHRKSHLTTAATPPDIKSGKCSESQYATFRYPPLKEERRRRRRWRRSSSARAHAFLCLTPVFPAFESSKSRIQQRAQEPEMR